MSALRQLWFRPNEANPPMGSHCVIIDFYGIEYDAEYLGGGLFTKEPVMLWRLKTEVEQLTLK